MKPQTGEYISSGTDALDFVVPVGKANEYVEYLNDLKTEGSFVNMDPEEFLIQLEEMELYEALQLVHDLSQTTSKVTK